MKGANTMKLPNGYGGVFKLPGNRRNPWIVRKTTGWDENGKQLYYVIGYFETRSKAMAALSEYNKNPIGERGDITLKDLYAEWSKSKYEKVGHKTVESYTIAWNHLSKIGAMQFKDIRKSHMQHIIDDMSKSLSRSSCHKVKVLAGLLYKHALADDIVNKNYAELLELPENDSKEKEPFSDQEIKAIEKLAKTDEWANTILILIYTGMRIGELLILTKFNIDIKNMIITGGIKTDAGKDRTIPIHKKIQDYIKEWYNKDGSYLISRNGDKIRVGYYRKYLYYPTLKKAQTRKLTPHSTRHTFGTLINNAGANTKSIQAIIGHADYSTTANIYTHPDIEELRKAIDLI